MQAAVDMWEGWHLALYVANFSSSYTKVADAGHIDNDHPYQDKCHSLTDALQHCQFRWALLLLLLCMAPHARCGAPCMIHVCTLYLSTAAAAAGCAGGMQCHVRQHSMQHSTGLSLQTSSRSRHQHALVTSQWHNG
jgi:hypothetical protein